MEALSAGDVFLFDGFRLERRGLFRRDENSVLAPVEIGSRALDVLRVLLLRPGDLLTRNEIIAAAWPERSSRTTTSTYRFRRCAACSTKAAPNAAASKLYLGGGIALSHP